MARTNNLTNFLTDVATAIKSKTGKSTSIPAANFDTEITTIETGGTYQSKTVTISANGDQTITPDQGYDAIDQIVIQTRVPIKTLQIKSMQITSNMNVEIEPDSGYDGFSKLNLEVNVPGSAINNQDKTITQNGTYTADEGYTGIGTATVNVQPDVKLFTTETELDAYIETNYNELQSGKKAVVYGDTEIQSIAPKEYFTEMYLPETIVLTKPVTRNILLGYYSKNDSGGGGSWELDDFLNPTSFYGGFHSQGGMLNFRYNSEDGITYIRESVEAYSYGWGPSEGSWNWDEDTSTATYDGTDTYFYYNTRNGGTDIVTQLFKREKTLYNGIYQYVSENDSSYRKYTANVGTILSSGVPAELDLCKLWYTASYYVRWGINPTITTKQGLSVLTFTEQFGYNADPVIFKDGNIYRIGLRVSASQSYRTDSTKSTSYTKYIHTESGTTSETITRYYKDMPYWKYSSSSYYYYFFELYNTTNISELYIIRGTQNSYCNISYVTVSSGSTYSYTTYNVSSATYTSNTALWTKQVCDTQMSLTDSNQLLPGYTCYGKNSPITGDGSIYNNLDDYEIETNIYNLTSTDKGYFSQLPAKAVTDITTRRRINWAKNSTGDMGSEHYICWPTLSGTSIPSATKLDGYYLNSQAYNAKNNKIISLQYKANDYRLVIQDGTTLEVLYNTQYSTERSYSIMSAQYGDYVYVYNNYYTGESKAHTYYLQVYRYNLQTYSRETVVSKTHTYDPESYNYNSFRVTSKVLDKKYLLWTYRYYYKSEYSYIYSYIVDLTTGTSYTILNGTSYDCSFSGINYDYTHIATCNTTSGNIYIHYALGYFGAGGCRLYRFVKSSNSISTMWTSTRGDDDTSDVDNCGYEDSSYIYFGTMILPKSSQTDYRTILDNVVDTDGDKIFTDNTYIGSLLYIDNAMYLLQGTALYHIVDNTFSIVLNNNKYVVTAVIDKKYLIPNKSWAYKLNENGGVVSMGINYNTLDITTLTIDTDNYILQSLDGSFSIKCIACTNGTSLDFDYSIICNGTDAFIQQIVE